MLKIESTHKEMKTISSDELHDFTMQGWELVMAYETTERQVTEHWCSGHGGECGQDAYHSSHYFKEYGDRHSVTKFVIGRSEESALEERDGMIRHYKGELEFYKKELEATTAARNKLVETTAELEKKFKEVEAQKRVAQEMGRAFESDLAKARKHFGTKAFNEAIGANE